MAYEFLNTETSIYISALESYFESNRTNNDVIKSLVNYTVTELETLEVDPDVEYKYANINLPPDNYA